VRSYLLPNSFQCIQLADLSHDASFSPSTGRKAQFGSKQTYVCRSRRAAAWGCVAS
jgi:hypothetical protein